jgi:hypothetical protein
MGDEPQKTISSFASNGAGETPFRLIGSSEDWEVELPSTSERVCSHFLNYSLYEVVFKDVGLRFLFSDFQREVFWWTKLSPPQIHPKSYAFMRAFELVCQHLEVTPFKNVFFTLFIVQRGVEKGGGSGWVCFRQKEKIFDIFAGKVRSWKER